MTENGFESLAFEELDWVPGEELSGLPAGVECAIVRADEGDGYMSLFVRFPPGYVEPYHSHEMEHWGVVVEGEMHVDGKVLKPGDFLRGLSNVGHGPLRYPSGVTIFTTTRGALLHRLDDSANNDDAGEAEL